MAGSTVTRALAVGVAGACVLVLSTAGASTAAFPGRNGAIVFASDTGENVTAQLFSIRSDGTGRKNLTHNRYSNLVGAWSPDGRRIAFVETETPGAVLAVMNADGSHEHRLTDMREWASDPAWSPDGSLIAYVQSYAPGTGIHLVHPDGTGDRLVAPGVFGSGFQPAWSPQGDRLAVVTPTARGSAALTVVDVRDGSTHELVRNGYFSNPAWSPDGGSIAYAVYSGAGYEIHTIQPEGEKDRLVTPGWRAAWSPDARRLAVVGDVNVPGLLTVIDADGANPVVLSEHACDYPSWSPDGRKIGYVENCADVYEASPDGTNRRRVTHEPPNSRVEHAAWSPQGNRILYRAAHEVNDQELYVIAAGRARRITRNGVADFNPTWSPDGTMIAFARQGPGYTSGIVVAAASGRGVHALTRRANDYSPTWSPDGSRIAFARAHPQDETESSLYVMRPDGSNVRKLGKGGDPAWSPDGKRIAFAHETEIWVMRSDGTHRRPVVSTVGTARALGLPSDQVDTLYAPSWSPDGKSLGFVAYYYLGGRNTDYLAGLTARSDGTHVKERISEVEPLSLSVEWSPDGRSLVFGAGDIFVAPVKGGKLVARTGLEGWSTDATWQPRCTAYGSGKSDFLRSSRGDDVVCGLGGNDTITGGAGRDRLFGEGGDDRIDARDGEFDVIGCGPGRDTVVADAIDLVGRDCERIVR